jgi:hypothetical protein
MGSLSNGPVINKRVFQFVVWGSSWDFQIYRAMKVVGPLVPQYSRLSKNEKIEWDNRLEIVFLSMGSLQLIND